MSKLREQFWTSCGITRSESIDKPLLEMKAYITWLENRVNHVCDKKCIHYGRSHPCVFCIRAKDCDDHYKTEQLTLF
jgi:hypothetical protein